MRARPAAGCAGRARAARRGTRRRGRTPRGGARGSLESATAQSPVSSAPSSAKVSAAGAAEPGLAVGGAQRAAGGDVERAVRARDAAAGAGVEARRPARDRERAHEVGVEHQARRRARRTPGRAGRRRAGGTAAPRARAPPAVIRSAVSSIDLAGGVAGVVVHERGRRRSAMVSTWVTPSSAAALVELDVDVAERLEPGADARRGPADPLGDGADAAVVAGEQRDDAVGLAQLLGAQDDALVAVEAHRPILPLPPTPPLVAPPREGTPRAGCRSPGRQARRSEQRAHETDPTTRHRRSRCAGAGPDEPAGPGAVRDRVPAPRCDRAVFLVFVAFAVACCGISDCSAASSSCCCSPGCSRSPWSRRSRGCPTTAGAAGLATGLVLLAIVLVDGRVPRPCSASLFFTQLAELVTPLPDASSPTSSTGSTRRSGSTSTRHNILD